MHPQVEVKTSDAETNSQKYPNERCGKTMGKCCRFGGWNFKNDNQLISRSLEDVLVEPVRSILIQKFDEVKNRVYL